MAQDAYGNYVADLSPKDVPNPSSGGGILSGVGPPDNSIGANGNVYVNITNGDVYTKSGDVWNISTGGTGTNNLSGAGSPIGVKTPDYVGQGYTDTVAPYHLWSAVGLTNNDWFEIV